MNGFYSGVRNLVTWEQYVPEQLSVNSTSPVTKGQEKPVEDPMPPMEPVPFNPYPDYGSYEYLQEYNPVEPCYIDDGDKVLPPDVYVYPGVPQNATAPYFGSMSELGIREDVCYDRFGRFGPYGYGYRYEEGGSGLGGQSENGGSNNMWTNRTKIDYGFVDWGKAQQRCYDKNKIRFERNAKTKDGKTSDPNKKLVKRHAYILRTWQGYRYDEHQLLTLRAMVSELSLKSGGEYDVHFLVHIKDSSIPIWTDDAVYQKTLEENVPPEFWGMATLWSDQLMKLYYPEPFPNNLENPSEHPIHSVYRSAHFTLQWFAQQHPEYDFYWNWEMDLRFTGHYYEFNNRIGEWAANQPRKGLWDRSAHYYIPSRHGSWSSFAAEIENKRIMENDPIIWGPVEFPNSGMVAHPPNVNPPTRYEDDKYSWGVGEDADLITFNPIFNPNKTNWVFRNDINGYNLSLMPPPRRTAIITVSRLSKRLLNLMHEETYKYRHSAFPEMWPATAALHHGLKATYAPHPVYFDRLWPLDYLDKVFNHPQKPEESPFGWGEHNQLGSSFYYNSGFSGALWRRWLGYKENGEGGSSFEKQGTGRVCLRPILFHPIKHENGPTD